jgi:hypothetical protein
MRRREPLPSLLASFLYILLTAKRPLCLAPALCSVGELKFERGEGRMQDNGGPMAAVFAAPGKYIQGRGAVGRLGDVLEQLGSGKPLMLCDPIVEEIMGGALEGLRGAKRVEFEGECSPEEIDRVTKAASDAFGRQRRAVLEGEARLPAVAP